MGKYTKNVKILYNTLEKLFNCMTTDEKMLILTFDFVKLWERIWNINYDKITNNIIQLLLNNVNYQVYPELQNYIIKRRYFDALNKNMVRNLINSSESIENMWEISKGRHDKNDENTIQTAIREVQEETGISYDQYTLLLNEQPLVETFDVDKTTYQNFYYIAIMNNYNTKFLFSNMQLQEITNIDWFSINDLSKTYNIRLPYIFKRARKILKKYKINKIIYDY